MSTVRNDSPFYVKIAYFMVAIITTTYVLCIGSGIILPLLFSTIFAILLNPIVMFLQKKRVPRIIAILLVITVAMSLVAGLIFFLTKQVSLLSNMLPLLKTKSNIMAQQIIQWISWRFNVPAFKLQNWLHNAMNSAVTSTSSLLGQTLITITTTLITIFLIPIYMFMILFYKTLIMEFLGKVFNKSKHHNIEVILSESKSLIQSYLVGLLIESVIVSTLNIIALLIIGVDFAVLLGIIGGILNVIPYIGGIVAVLLPMIIALTTQSANAALWVLVAYAIVQFLDNNILMHYVVASKVKINALASIIVVLTGGAIWGIPGMFLSLPLTAIFKVIFDRIEDLKPFATLLGDTIPTKQNFFFKKPVVQK